MNEDDFILESAAANPPTAELLVAVGAAVVACVLANAGIIGRMTWIYRLVGGGGGGGWWWLNVMVGAWYNNNVWLSTTTSVEFLLFTSLSSLIPSARGHSLRTGITHLLGVRQCHVRGLRATITLYKKKVHIGCPS